MGTKKNIDVLPGVDHSAAIKRDVDDINAETAARDIQTFIDSAAYRHAADLRGVDAIRAGIARVNGQAIQAPDFTSSNQALDEADQLAAQFAGQQQTGGPIAAAQRLLLQNQMGQLATGGAGLAKLGAAQNQATGMAARGAQQASDAAAGQAMGITGNTAAARLKQYVMEGLAHHGDMQRLMGVTGMNNAIKNADVAGRQQLASSAMNATLGADAQSIRNDATNFNNTMQMVRGGLSAAGAGIGAAVRASQAANQPFTFQTNNGPATGAQINQANGYGQYRDPALTSNSFGAPSSRVYGGGDFNMSYEPTEALA